MKLRTSWIVSILASLLLASGPALAQTPTFSLQAVAVNDVAITPSNSVMVKPGDTIVAEIFLSDWSPLGQRLLSYQADIPRAAFRSGATGVVTPVGWDRPITMADDIGCGPAAPCPVEFPVCAPVFMDSGFCVGPNYDPAQGVFIEANRADWVFVNPDTGSAYVSIQGVDFSGISLRYGALLLRYGDTRTYAPPRRYCGTVRLEVSDDASGAFSFEFSRGEQGGSELRDVDTLPIEPLTGIGLTVHIDPCGNGVIDAGEACDGEDLGACAGACADDCTCRPVEIPTVSTWGLTALALSLLAAGRVYFGRRLSHRLAS